MPVKSLLPADLSDAARFLENQFELMHLESRRIPLNEWDSLPPKLRALIPPWLTELLSNHSLVGPVLERPHERHKWKRYFSFWQPMHFSSRITLASDDPIMTKEIIDAGLIPLSDESDGDMWVTSITAGPSSPIHLFELSAWEKTLAGDSLAIFLAGCVVNKEQTT